MMNVQDPRIALTSMMYDGVFDQALPASPRRHDRINGRMGRRMAGARRLPLQKYLGHTSRDEAYSAAEYFARNIWVSANPEERMFPLMVQFRRRRSLLHLESDYPHAEGFVRIRSAPRANCSPRCRNRSVGKILCDNAAAFYRI